MEKIVRADGWYLDNVVGSHHHYKYKIKKGKVTIPNHGKIDLPPKTIKSILKQAGLN